MTKIREWPFLTLIWPKSLFLISVVVLLSIGFCIAFFSSSGYLIPLIFSTILSVYFNVVFWTQIISLFIESVRARREPLEKTEPVVKFYDDIRFPRVLILMFFSILQQVFIVAAVDRGWPDQFIPVTLGGNTATAKFLRAFFAAFDTLATIGFGTLRPLKLFSVYLVILNVYQVYFLDLVLVAIVLTNVPKRIEWIARLRSRGVFASAKRWGVWVMSFRFCFHFLFFGLGFIENLTVYWILFSFSIPFVMHGWIVIAVYIYNTALRRNERFNVFWLLVIYLDAILSVGILVALSTAAINEQITLLEVGVSWIFRYPSSMAYTIDTVIGYGTFQFTPYGSWALVLTSMITIEGFILRIFVFTDVISRFFQTK